MGYQLGFDGLMKFQETWKKIKTALEDNSWDLVGAEILDSKAARQTPSRFKTNSEMMITGQLAEAGAVSYGPKLLLTGEYPDAKRNPELTAPLNFIKDEMISATEKIINKVSQNYEKNPELTSVAVEQRIMKTVEKAVEMQNRLKQKENMETSKIKMNVPIVNNNVVDNKQVTNNNQSLLMKQSSRNPQNIFRLD